MGFSILKFMNEINISIKNLCNYPLSEDFSSTYEIIKSLSKGKSSEIFEINNKYSHQKNVAKVISKAKIMESKIYLIQLINEIKLLDQINHTNIVKTHKVYEDNKFVYIIMDCYSNGDLLNYVTKKGFLNENETLAILYQILKGLEYLDKHSIVHNDLKLENIFIEQKKGKVVPIIGDFGFACKWTERQPKEFKNIIVGTPGYIAPELLNSDYLQSQSQINDVFSLGCIMYIMLCGRMPFYGESVQELIEENQYSQPQINFINKVQTISSSTLELLEKMLKKNPNSRITVSDALKHKAFKKINCLKISQLRTFKASRSYSTQSLKNFNTTQSQFKTSRNLSILPKISPQEKHRTTFKLPIFQKTQTNKLNLSNKDLNTTTNSFNNKAFLKDKINALRNKSSQTNNFRSIQKKLIKILQ